REPQPGTTPSPRRLSAVTLEDELPLGVDAIDMVSDGRKEAAETVAAAEEPTLDLSKTAAAVRERRPVDAGDLTVETADADWMATQASERPAEHQRPAERERPAEQVEEEHVDAVAEAQVETEQEPAPEPPARKPARKKGRASVPSWDEIMFGGGRAE
ncbi:MAG: septation protein SepH, partial [Nocardioidaceae bacterium]